eukprot:GDKI01014258.1.p1 GENE.GDKI01014258.1~~GDKI01014258.1.p1  ORF type:complete len:144 (-),score=39.63 GDKI01014258.1:53-484(-)
MSLFQPVTQVRLTNVAIVKLKSHGKRFEIACYKNKVMNWKTGIEKDISEVLQSPHIFENVSKGQFAKKDAIVQVFGTADEEQVARLILEKGEVQISDKERDMYLESLFKDISSIVTEKVVNLKTGVCVCGQVCLCFFGFFHMC